MNSMTAEQSATMATGSIRLDALWLRRVMTIVLFALCAYTDPALAQSPVATCQQWDTRFIRPSGMPAGCHVLRDLDIGNGPELFGAGPGGSPVSRWTNGGWKQLGPSLGGDVYALAAYDDGSGLSLYAGGTFTGATGNYVARWTGSAWTSVGSVSIGTVYSLCVYDDGTGPALYAGGASTVLRWNGAQWAAVTGAPIGFIEAFAILDSGSGPVLFAGGRFTVGGVQANVAQYKGAAWTIVLPSTSGVAQVESMITFNDGSGPSLYVGGTFTIAGGAPSDYVARWNGASWNPVCTGLYAGSVWALAGFDAGNGPELYIGGTLTAYDAGGNYVSSGIARWTGSTWEGIDGGCNGEVESLAVHDNGHGSALYAGGTFVTAGGIDVDRVARWDGASWMRLVGLGLDGPVSAMLAIDASPQESLVVSGSFSTAGGVHATGIASWNDTNWSAFGANLDRAPLALTLFDDGSGPSLIAGGAFTSSGGTPLSGITKWTGSAWAPLGSGVKNGGGLPGADVQALATFDDGAGPKLYASGNFAIAGGSRANHIARWDGMNWSPVGSGLNQAARSLCVYDDGGGPRVYAGGEFTIAGGHAAHFIAQWDGNAWTPVGSGMDGVVNCLTVYDDGTGEALIAGGEFFSAGGTPANHIAKWDGASWKPLGAGFNDFVNAIAVFDDGSGPALYSGGWFDKSGTTSISRLARWDGQAWSDVALGVDGTVTALTPFVSGASRALYVGGTFMTAGGTDSSRIAAWRGCEPTIAPYGSGCTGTGGRTPSLGVAGSPKPTRSLHLTVRDGFSGSTALLFLGLSEVSISIGDTCSLLVGALSPLVLPIPLNSDGKGGFVTPLPANVPVISIYLQAFVIDPARAIGAAASNGIRINLG